MNAREECMAESSDHPRPRAAGFEPVLSAHVRARQAHERAVLVHRRAAGFYETRADRERERGNAAGANVAEERAREEHERADFDAAGARLEQERLDAALRESERKSNISLQRAISSARDPR
jgi:hypothetical protein